MTPPTGTTASAAPDGRASTASPPHQTHQTHQTPGTAAAATDEAAATALTRAMAAGSSFYWGMKVLPRPRRDAIFAVYAFCREVDDIADEPTRTREQKIAGLAEWRARIDALYGGPAVPPYPLEAPLRLAVQRFAMAREDFLAVIEGMEMDARGPVRAPDLATLDHYCDCVAAAVGRLAVRAFGCPDEAGRELADRLGRALQLTNILRDIAEDAAEGRLYLPREVLERHGIGTDDPALVLHDPALTGACREIAGMAQEHFDAAYAAAARCPKATVRPARIMAAVYQATLDALRAADWRDPTRRLRLSKTRKLWIVLRHGVF